MIIIFIICIIFLVFLVSSCCVNSKSADQIADEAFEKYKKEQEDKK